MQSTINKLPKSQLEITVELSAEELRPYLAKAAEKLSQEIKIDGFRPGKAPFEIVKNKVGEMAILEEALDDIISKTYFEVVKKENLITLGQPKINVEKMAPNNPLVYKATVAILPKVKIGDYAKIKISRQLAAVKDEQVEKVLGEIQRMRAKEKPVAREAKTGDLLQIDFDVYLDQVPIENGRQQKYPITIGEGRFIPGFEEQLIGLKAGDTKEFPLSFPASYHAKNLAGKLCDFKVKVNAVFELEVPALDEEFAKSVSNGAFATPEELKSNIRKNLEEEEKAKAEQQLEVEIFKKLVAISEFEELPEVLVENEAHKMVHELEHSVTSQGANFEDYLKELKKTHDDLEQEFLRPAEERVKTAILSREIFQAQNFKVSDEAVAREIEETLKGYPANPEMKAQLESEAYRDYLKNVLGNRQVMDYLKGVMAS